jgi:hypothetical protein
MARSKRGAASNDGRRSSVLQTHCEAERVHCQKPYCEECTVSAGQCAGRAALRAAADALRTHTAAGLTVGVTNGCRVDSVGEVPMDSCNVLGIFQRTAASSARAHKKFTANGITPAWPRWGQRCTPLHADEPLHANATRLTPMLHADGLDERGSAGGPSGCDRASREGTVSHRPAAAAPAHARKLGPGGPGQASVDQRIRRPRRSPVSGVEPDGRGPSTLRRLTRA